MPGVAGKVKYTVYLTSENVKYLRERTDLVPEMKNGISGLLDGLLSQYTALVKRHDKGKGPIKVVYAVLEKKE